jgi:hypothetical protein
MRRILSSLIPPAAVLVLALAGCVTTEVVNRAEPAKDAELDGAAPNDDMATVVFFRPSRAEGGMVTFEVREGEEVLGKLSSGSYFVARVPPGEHMFVARYRAQDALKLRVERGRTYYVRITIAMSLGKPQPSRSDAETFNSIKAKLKDSAASNGKS